MIGSPLTEQKTSALFLYSSIETGLYRVERTLPTPGNVNKQTSTLLKVAPCQRVVGKRLSIWNNRVSMDESRKSVFFQANRSFDLSGAIKLVKFRLFIY